MKLDLQGRTIRPPATQQKETLCPLCPRPNRLPTRWT